MAHGRAGRLSKLVGGQFFAIALTAATVLAGAPKPAVSEKRPAEPAKLDAAPATKLEKAGTPTPATVTPTGATPDNSAAPAANAETPSAPSADGFVLKYKFEVNQSIWYEVDQTVEIMSQKERVKATDRNESHTLKHYRVIAIEDSGNALLELVIDKVRMSAQTEGEDPVSFDSESKDDPPARFENIRQVVGKPLARVTATPQGEIKSTIWLNGQKNGGEAPDADASNNFLIALPNRALRPGDGWTDKSDVRVFVSPTLTRNVTILRKYELSSVKDSLATIRVVSTVLTPVQDPKIEGQLIQRTPSGTVVFDIEKGAIVSRDLKLDNTVIGIFDDNSSMRVVSNKTEKLIPREKALRTAGDDPKRN